MLIRGSMIDTQVTRPFLPPVEEFMKRVFPIFDRDILTNQGPNVLEFERTMKEFLAVEHFHFVTNGTIALQLALRVSGITEGEVITTPFSYVATVSSILWEHCVPVFVDIEPDNFTIDATKIEAAITEKTRAIMPVHVFGYACDMEAIGAIAEKHGLKVIYDAAHSFGSKYKGRSLVSYGDVSVLSFHATKWFHTIEGGGIVTHDPSLSERLELMKRFGHDGDEYVCLGINAKQDEFNAAMGLCNFRHLSACHAERRTLSELYDSCLDGSVYRPSVQPDVVHNYAYYPVLFPDEDTLLRVLECLKEIRVFPRRYFNRSLNTLPYLKQEASCPIAEDISSRIACLPLFCGLSHDTVKQICRIINRFC